MLQPRKLARGLRGTDWTGPIGLAVIVVVDVVAVVVLQRRHARPRGSDLMTAFLFCGPFYKDNEGLRGVSLPKHDTVMTQMTN